MIVDDVVREMHAEGRYPTSIEVADALRDYCGLSAVEADAYAADLLDRTTPVTCADCGMMGRGSEMTWERYYIGGRGWRWFGTCRSHTAQAGDASPVAVQITTRRMDMLTDGEREIRREQEADAWAALYDPGTHQDLRLDVADAMIDAANQRYVEERRRECWDSMNAWAEAE